MGPNVSLVCSDTNSYCKNGLSSSHPWMQMNKTVFLIDDHVEMLSTLQRVINNQKELEVCGVSSTPVEALSRISMLKPDLVITDFNLPVMNGIEVTSQLLKDNPDQYVLILSAYSNVKYAEKTLASGARGYITKGNATQLLEGIKSVLDGELYVSSELKAEMAHPS